MSGIQFLITLMITITWTSVFSAELNACSTTSLWKTGDLTVDMITPSSNPGDVSKLRVPDPKPTGGTEGWCGDNQGSSLDIEFPEAIGVGGVEITQPKGTSGGVVMIDIQFEGSGNSVTQNFGQQNISLVGTAPGSSRTIHWNAVVMTKLRINFIQSVNRPCLNLDVMGCPEKDVCPGGCKHGGKCVQLGKCYCTPEYTGDYCDTRVSGAGGCFTPEGMESGAITSASLSVSSSAKQHPKDKARLSCCKDEDLGAWCPDENDKDPWFEVRFPKPRSFSGIILQPPYDKSGVVDNYVERFALEYISSQDPAKVWRIFNDDVPGIKNESYSQMTLYFQPKATVDAIKIRPLSYKTAPCMRFEVLGCDPKSLCPAGFCQNGGTCIAENTCQCPKGYFGTKCESAANTLKKYLFQFQTVTITTITTTIHITLRITGSVTVIKTSLGQAISITGGNNYVTVDNSNFHSCLLDIDHCSSGFTLNVNVQFQTLPVAGSTYIISSGGDLPDGKGLALYYLGGKVYFIVSTTTQVWRIETTYTIQTNVWNHFELSWNKLLGIEVINNGKLIGSALKPTSRPNGVYYNHNLTLGYGFTQTTHITASILIQGLQTFDLHRSEVINQGLITTTTAASTISTVTPTTTSVPTLAPTTKVTTTMTSSPQVTVISACTTSTKPIKSIGLAFIGLVENVLITPLHNFTVHGNPTLKAENNGGAVLVLSQSGQYVELPNTGLECLQDLTTCDKGFTLKVEIKLYKIVTDDKRYIFSSGGDQVNSSGIALYLWHGELYCSVKWNKTIWTAKKMLSLKDNEWHTYQVSWNQKDGFIVYIDGILFMDNYIVLRNPVQESTHPLLIAKGFSSNVTTLMDIRNLFAWTASRDVLICEKVIQEYTTPKPTQAPTTTPTTTSTPRPTTPSTTTTTTTPKPTTTTTTTTTTTPTTTTTTTTPTTTTTTTTPTTTTTTPKPTTTTTTTPTPTTTTTTTTTTTPTPTTTTTVKPTTEKNIETFVWNFTQLVSGTALIPGNPFPVSIHGGIQINSTMNAILFTNTSQYIDFGNHTHLCLNNISTCSNGFTFEINILLKKLEENTLILTSGGENPDGTGIAIVYKFGGIQVIISQKTHSWFAFIPREKVHLHSFIDLVVSWRPDKGLVLYVEKKIVAHTVTSISHHLITNTAQHLVIGTAPTTTLVTSSVNVNFYLQTFKCWHIWIDIAIDIGIIFPGYDKTTTATTSKATTPATTTPKPTTPTTVKATKPTAIPTEKSTKRTKPTPVCHTGWICKDDLTTPITTRKTKPTTKPTTPKPTTPTTKPTTRKPTTTPTTTTTTTPKPTKPGLPVYTKPPTLEPGVTGTGVGYFVCKFAKTIEQNVELIVTINIDGQSKNFFVVPGISDEYRFTMDGINENLHNKHITCSVQARFIGLSELTIKLTSNVIVPKITLHTNHKLVLTEGHLTPQNITISTSVPPQMYCCSGCKGKCTVHIEAKLNTDRYDTICKSLVIPEMVVGWKGSSQSARGELCGATMNEANWKYQIVLPVSATVDNLYDRDYNNQFTVQAVVTNTAPRPSTHYVAIGTVQVQSKNNDHKAMCTSLNDPHITTFDGQRYDNFHTGEFVLYKHKELPYKVTAQYQYCGSHRGRTRPTCNCAVAIQSGDDVITFSSCSNLAVHSHHHSHSPTPITVRMYKNGELNPGTRIRRLGCGQKYEVHLPTGTIITVQSSARPFINIWVKPSSVDYGHTEGLCGLYDRNRRNDVIDNNGRPITSRHPDVFSLKWKTSHSIFTGVAASIVPGITKFCSCVKGKQAFCVGGHSVMRCLEMRYDITSTIVRQARLPVLRQRVRRQAEADGSVDIIPTPTVDLSMEQAEKKCRDYIVNSTVTKHCRVVVNNSDIEERVQNCAVDLNATGDEVWAADSVKDIVEECLEEIVRTPIENVDRPLPQINGTDMCSENCGPYGSCEDGVCQCISGYSGLNCSVSKSVQPTVYKTLTVDGGCDVRQTDTGCDTAMIIGDNFVESDDLTCHYQYVSVTDRVRRLGEMHITTASFINMNQVICMLPDENRGAYISISNDGVTVSDNAFLHLVYDAKCFTCSIENNTQASHCSRRDHTCIINGDCFTSGDSKAADKYKICDPSVSSSTWTDTCSEDPTCTSEVKARRQNPDEDIDRTQIIILAVVCGVLGLGLLLSIIHICRHSNKTKTEKGSYNISKRREYGISESGEKSYDNPVYN